MPLAPQDMYRVSIAGSQPEQKSHADVQSLVDANTANVLIMSLDQTSGWQDPSAFGIQKSVPDTPPAPTTPSAPAAPMAPATPANTAQPTDTKGFAAMADKFFAGFSEKIARKLAKMAGQPDPITGEKQPTPHAAPQVATTTQADQTPTTPQSEQQPTTPAPQS